MSFSVNNSGGSSDKLLIIAIPAGDVGAAAGAGAPAGTGAPADAKPGGNATRPARSAQEQADVNAAMQQTLEGLTSLLLLQLPREKRPARRNPDAGGAFSRVMDFSANGATDDAANATRARNRQDVKQTADSLKELGERYPELRDLLRMIRDADRRLRRDAARNGDGARPAYDDFTAGERRFIRDLKNQSGDSLSQQAAMLKRLADLLSLAERALDEQNKLRSEQGTGSGDGATNDAVDPLERTPDGRHLTLPNDTGYHANNDARAYTGAGGVDGSTERGKRALQNLEDHSKMPDASANGIAEDLKNLADAVKNNDVGASQANAAAAQARNRILPSGETTSNGAAPNTALSDRAKETIALVDAHVAMSDPSREGLAADVKRVDEDVRNGDLTPPEGRRLKTKLYERQNGALSDKGAQALANADAHASLVDPSTNGLREDLRRLEDAVTNGDLTYDRAEPAAGKILTRLFGGPISDRDKGIAS